jgi:PIN domain nuclease of toxin-antitoxin system
LILLDTHVWYWWLSSSPQLPPALADAINAERAADAVAVSVISCWEIAQKAAAGRLDLKAPAAQWLGRALADPRTLLQPLTPEIVVSAVALPGNFHRDPAD